MSPTASSDGPNATDPSEQPAGAATTPSSIAIWAEAVDACQFSDVEAMGVVVDSGLTEISGAAVSRAHPDLVWVHNDSGDAAIVYAVETDGDLRAMVMLTDVLALDWEDIAIGPAADGRDHLFVADIGDNFLLRSLVFVYRFPEPDPMDGAVVAERIGLEYPDGPHDAEAIAVDPGTGDLFVITKGGAAPPSMYRARAATLIAGARVVLELIGQLAVTGQVTAADFTPEGDRLFVRTYEEVLIFARRDAELVETIVAEPCAGPVAREHQGEALGAHPDGGYVTISEGRNQTIWRTHTLNGTG